MQSKTNNGRISRAQSVGAVLCACSVWELTPSVALGWPAEDVLHKAASTPWVWGGVGFVAGAATMAVVSHAVHKAKISELEERLENLEDFAVPYGTDAESTQEHGADVVPQTPAADEHKANQVEAPAKPSTAERDVSSMHTHRLSTTASGEQFPRIERAQDNANRWGNTGSLERAHATEVMRRLDPTTRARMIERRIPSVASLVGIEEEKGAHPDPEATMRLDPAAYIDRILQEEMQRASSNEPAHARPRLTVIEGMAVPSETPNARMAHAAHIPTIEYGQMTKEA